jgi:hypothetical protein
VTTPTAKVVALRAALGHLEIWSRSILSRPLRPYQLEPAAAILRSIGQGRGDAITVMMSRQAGKNELSAHLESFLLANRQRRLDTLVKAAPTFKPQTINSLLRLTALLDNPVTAGRWVREHGYIVRLDRARAFFFSAELGANVVGATATLALEIDEAQDVDPAKHDKDFAPMAASTNATRVYYGTAWDDATLLQRQIDANEESAKRDGVRRHFAYPWDVVAEHNPAYGAFVQGERERLGAEHPLFRTQYLLKTISGEAGFLSPTLQAQLRGHHRRRDSAAPDATYLAALDIAGGAEQSTEAGSPSPSPAGRGENKRRLDSTVLLIARVDWQDVGPEAREPVLAIEGVHWWTGVNHRSQYETLLDLLRNVWRVRRLAVDATGLGAPIADFLTTALGSDVVDPVTFTAATKSDLAYNLLAAIGGGRLKWYAASEDDLEAREFWEEARACRYQVRPNRTMSFFVPDGRGHDDFITALALLASAARTAPLPPAAAMIVAKDPYGE